MQEATRKPHRKKHQRKCNSTSLAFENRTAIENKGKYYCPKCYVEVEGLSKRNQVVICDRCLELVRLPYITVKCINCGRELQTNSEERYCKRCVYLKNYYE